MSLVEKARSIVSLAQTVNSLLVLITGAREFFDYMLLRSIVHGMSELSQLLGRKQVAAIVDRDDKLFPEKTPIGDVTIEGRDSKFRQLDTALVVSGWRGCISWSLK